MIYINRALTEQCHVMEVVRECIKLYKDLYPHDVGFLGGGIYKWSWIYTVAKFNAVSCECLYLLYINTRSRQCNAARGYLHCRYRLSIISVLPYTRL